MNIISDESRIMSSALHEQPYLESWRWMSRQIRCAMEPDEPRLIEHYLAEGRYLACCTRPVDDR
jgi:hypothetical protein